MSHVKDIGVVIPIAYNKNGDVVKIPKENLPVKLPENIKLDVKAILWNTKKIGEK